MLKWTDQIPTIPGWYWEKNPDGDTRILYLPHCNQWPTPWQKRKSEALTVADDDEMRQRLDKLNWVVQWAGPIEMPA